MNLLLIYIYRTMPTQIYIYTVGLKLKQTKQQVCCLNICGTHLFGCHISIKFYKHKLFFFHPWNPLTGLKESLTPKDRSCTETG